MPNSRPPSPLETIPGAETFALWVDAAEAAPLLSRQATRDIVGLEPSGSSDKGRVRLADYLRLTRAHAVASLEESLGFAPRPLVKGTTDFVIAQAPIGGELQEAMGAIAAAYNRLHGGNYNMIEANAERCAFVIDDRAFPYVGLGDASVTLMLECVLISLHGVFCALTGRDLTPELQRVHTRRPQRGCDDPMAFWPCAVEYGAPVFALRYSADCAQFLVREKPREATVHDRVLGLIEKREAALSAGKSFAPLVRQCLRAGARNQLDAARRLGCSVATLRRRLTLEGLSFRRLRLQHLNETAKLALLQAERIADVAEALGFSDPRSFARAFKSWNEQSPQSYRNSAKSGP